MIVPYSSKFNRWKYIEVAAYREWKDKATGKQLNAVVREKDQDDPVFYEWGEDLKSFRDSNDSKGIYTSVLFYDEKDVDSLRLGSLYFDFDSESDPSRSLDDARVLYGHLINFIDEEHIRLFYTGSKGFHIEVEPLPLGVMPSARLYEVYGYIALDLQAKLKLPTLDTGIYDKRRMWRLPNTIHQKTGLYKVELDKDFFTSDDMESIKKYAAIPQGRFTPSSLALDMHANEWYKEYVNEMETKREEQRQEALAKRAALYEKYGTSLMYKPNQKKIDKIWANALEQLKSSVDNENRNITLSRQSFALFVNILESDMPDQEEFITRYEDMLYDVGLSIGLLERETKATIQSALKAAQDKTAKNAKALVSRR